LCRWVDLVEDPVSADANAQQVIAAAWECPVRTQVVGEKVGGLENLS
jgi:hypothetical protein